MGGDVAYTHPLSFQKMELALVPVRAHGNFYEGDCYVILSVSTLLLLPTPVSFSPGASSWALLGDVLVREDSPWYRSQWFLSAMSRPPVYQRPSLGLGFKFCIRGWGYDPQSEPQ